ncbi:MFS transporter [Burkholderia sp. Ac-20353]|uniref:MFS transporter n=1 Tax=Burkholderia sp. Ac-20353 TaxID=2703894 RepID=UPI00197C8C3B|nr:MFS transporter [Burkholderia sp. Ac-20353]MBN3792066.1 MHS family MFS transporter [Burkholderia sp. Ac-20353]
MARLSPPLAERDARPATASGTPADTDARRRVDEKQLNRAAWTCSLGSALEYYDFALYTLAAALVFGPLFFPAQTAEMRLIASFGTYFVGFAVRPLGGVVFGVLGDRIGRKFVLTATVLLMGIASTLIGVLPTFATAGYWAPALLVLLRILQGLGAGAEQAGAAVLMTEYAPAGRRGWYASLPFLGIQLGTVLAAAVYFVLLANIGRVTDNWGWRVPFLLSAVIVGVGLYMRVRLHESPTFVRLEKRAQVAANPLKSVVTHSKRSLLIGIGLRMAENGGSSIYQALAISYLAGVIGMKGPIGALALVCAATVGAVTVPLAGRLSDRFGRVRVYRAFAWLQLALAFPVWWIFSQGNVVASVIAISVAQGFANWGMLGAQSALLPELFGARHRYMGVSFSREASAVLAGGIAPLVGATIIATVIALHGGDHAAGVRAWVPIAAYLSVLTLITLFTTSRMPETLNRDLDDPLDATDASAASTLSTGDAVARHA